jgi:hypothetical protein
MQKLLNIESFYQKNSTKWKQKRIKKLGIVENSLMSGFVGIDFVVFRFSLW